MTTPSTVKCLSVRQPSADLIIHGDKWCENRTWRTHYRGPLYIHASKWENIPDDRQSWIDASPGKCEIGHVIGFAELVDCIHIDDMDRIQDGETIDDHVEASELIIDGADPESWRHVMGDWCWILLDPEPIEPIPAKGKLNLWSFELPS